MEPAELQCDTILKQKYARNGFQNFTRLFHEKGFQDYNLLVQELLLCLEELYVNNFFHL